MDPDEVVSATFTTAVGLIVIFTIYATLFGGDVQKIVNIATNFAVPFIFFLIFLYIIIVINEGQK